VAIGSGKTGTEALRDLKETARFCIDSLIDLKLREIAKEA